MDLVCWIWFGRFGSVELVGLGVDLVGIVGFGLVDLVWWMWFGGFGLVDLVLLGGFGLVWCLGLMFG